MTSPQSVLSSALCVLLVAELLGATQQEQRDPYEVLGVPRTASQRQIKKAFHRLAMAHHPDKNKSPDAEARFHEIAEAYELLSDEKQRRDYDTFGWRADTGGAPGSGFHQQHQQPHHQEGANFDFNFDDFFRHFDDAPNFGFRRQAGRGGAHARANWASGSHERPRHASTRQQFFDTNGLFEELFRADPLADSIFNSGGSTGHAHAHAHAHGHAHGHAQAHAQTRAHGGARSQHCRTVTQRIGNMVTTYTECSGA